MTLARHQMALAGELLEFFPPLDPGKIDDVSVSLGSGQMTGNINQILVGQIGNKEVNGVDDVSALWRTF